MTLTLRTLAPVLVAAALAPHAAAAPAFAFDSSPSYVPGEVLVKFKPQASANAAAAAVASKGHSVLRSLGGRAVKQVKTAPGQAVEEAIAAYEADPSVEYAQPNYVYRLTALPNDPSFGQLWGFRNTHQTISPASYPYNNPGTSGADARMERAWNVRTDCSTVTVAVIDSGVNHHHDDLEANMWNGGGSYPNHGWDFVGNDADPMDEHGHGTHVAGTIGAVANNGVGVAGVCWSASIMAVRVMDADGTGTSAWISGGIDFAVANGAKVINMSLGGEGFDSLINDAITDAQQADVAVIVAAGNEGNNIDLVGTTYPCAFTHPNLLCVAALDQAFALATFSNYGATHVDVGAPGTNIKSAWYMEQETISDALTSGWSFSPATGGWGYSTLATNIGPVHFLVSTPGFPNGTYPNNFTVRAYKTFDLSNAAIVTVSFAAFANVAFGDLVGARCSKDVPTADPYSGPGVTMLDENGAYWNGESMTLDATGCAGGPASVGFSLRSDPWGAGNGIGIALFSITKQTPSNSGYNTIVGTSMATPLAAGVATLLRAQNPLYTAVDVVEAIKASGRPVTALAGKTKSGRAVDAAAAVAHIRPPGAITVTKP
jgi:subtilisin family serine protease